MGWADGGHTKPVIDEEYETGHPCSHRVWNHKYASIFTPIRYNHISRHQTQPRLAARPTVVPVRCSQAAAADGAIQLSDQRGSSSTHQPTGLSERYSTWIWVAPSGICHHCRPLTGSAPDPSPGADSLVPESS